MSEVKQTKGYLNVTAKIISLNNKKNKDYPRSKELNFGLQTNKDHIVFCRAKGFKKDDDDTILVEYYDENKKRQIKKDVYSNAEWLNEGESVVGTKIKFKQDGEVQSFVDVDAVDKIAEGFHDGDVVTVNLTTEVDTYFKTLKFNVNKIYASSKDMDFTQSNFEEECHGRQWIVFNKLEDNILSAFVFNKKEEGVELKFQLDTEYITPKDFVGFKQGSVLQIEYETYKRPLYDEVTDNSIPKETTNKFVPKGKYASEVNNNNRIYQQISGYEEVFRLVGISNVNNEDVYDLTQYISEENSEEEPF